MKTSHLSTALFLVLLSVLFASCDRHHHVAYYHWKSTGQKDAISQKHLDHFKVKQLYTHYFDVRWIASESQAFPVASLKADSGFYPEQEIIPTVFIENDVFKHTSSQNLPQLIFNIAEKIKRKHLKITGKPTPKELHLDCDWTPSTQKVFFQFLRDLKKETSIEKISCTIRLHQLKYPKKTGVPPVEYGILMCYNMGDLASIEEQNSILNLATTKSYFDFDHRYELPLKVALPLFSWAVHFRGDRPIQLINGVRKSDVLQDSNFTHLPNGRFELKKSQSFFNKYLYQGDQLRIEQIEMANLQELLKLVETKVRPRDFDILFYHLDSTILKHYKPHELEEIL